MAKRIMEEFSISEISAVDRPAQKGAKMTIMKRDFSTEERERLAESGAAMSDGSFPIVTTADLKNAVEAYGRASDKEAAKRHIIRRARALDAVDELPDDWNVTKLAEAVDTITKRWIDPADGPKPFSTFLEASMEGVRFYEVMDEVGPLINALDNSLRSIAGSSDMESSAKQIAMREGVEEFLIAIRSKWPKVEEEIAEVFTDLDKGSHAGEPAGDHIGKKEHSMSGAKQTVADLKSSVAAITTVDGVKKAFDSLVELLEKSEAEKADAETLAKMSDAERTHMAGLKDDKAKKDFMGMSPEDRKKAVGKAAEADEVVKIEGTEVRKSVVGEAQFSIMKAQAKRIEGMEKRQKEDADKIAKASFEKRADEDFKYVPGSVEERGAMLKAIDGMDDGVKKAFEAVLTAHEALAKGAFDTLGHQNGQVAEGSAQDKLDKLAKAHADKNSVSFAKASDAVLQTDEGKALYREITGAA